MSTAMSTQTADATDVRTLRQLRRRPLDRVRVLTRAARRHEPRHRGGARARAALVRRRPRRRRARRARGAPRVARTRARARAPPVHAARGARRPPGGLARSVTTEMGKTLPDARAEVGAHDRDGRGRLRGADDDAGPILEDVARNVDAETMRQPVGVCAAIVPFNFPAMVPFWFLPFAIACGNTFILKPSEQVPLTQADRLRAASTTLEPAAGRRQPRQRRPRGRQRDPRPPRHRRRLVRRLGEGRAARLRARRPPAASACRRSAAPRTTWS